LGVDLTAAIDQSTLNVYRLTLQEIGKSLLYDIDPRTATKIDIEVLIADFREIIKGFDDLRSTLIDIPLKTIAVILENIALARNELLIALDILDKENQGSIDDRRLFYACLTVDCPKYLDRAIPHFRFLEVEGEPVRQLAADLAITEGVDMDVEQQHLQRLIAIKQNRLRVLELQEATLGTPYAPPQIITEIGDLRREIFDLKMQLIKLAR
jgi:hypothetical protein